MKLNLPVHPTMRHALTGEPLRALYVDSKGRARYPIMGGAPDDPPVDPPKTDPPADPPKTDPPADPPKTDAPNDLGFPKDTPVAQMKPQEQAAYHLHQSRKHEGRSKEWQAAFDGKTAAEVKAELEALRREKLSDQEKAVEDAKKEAREAATREHGPKSVRAAFELLLGDMPQDDRDAEIDVLDLSKFLNDDGDVDTAKVRKAAEKLNPAVKAPHQQRVRNWPNGDRRTDKSSGVKAGRDLYADRRKSTSSTTDS